ncbi:MAG: Rieske 2Fe-2S domain-containing protein [Myxococcota bacterium]|nr:Rieske 2Fe-2S domain-containing protein [Myxococcota bacterium]
MVEDESAPGIPNGWYAVAWSHELGPAEVKRVHYFAEELVLFRTRTGRARVLSAYCPHLGAHLAEGGRVSGETIRCPFHAWQYDGETGACVAIPYCDRIPPKARVQKWEAVERNGMIFVWHHDRQAAPDWEVPEISQFSDPAWSEPRIFEIEVPVHVQDMAENNLDPVHFQVVHSAVDVPETELVFDSEGRFFTAVSHTEQETPWGTFKMELLRDTWCIGMSSVESRGIPETGLYMFSSTSPIDRYHAISRWALTATKNMVDTAGEEWFDALTKGLRDDMRIWTHKVHRREPVLCEADKMLGDFRRWTKQFYSQNA